MRSSLALSIIKTLIYADVFDYPLTLSDIEEKLIQMKSSRIKVQNILGKLPSIQQKEGYFFLKGRDHIVSLRKRREIWSREKMKRAMRVVFLLRFIPTIQLIGVSGALATNNATENDDIDLFIITSSGTLWTTRFVTTLLLDFLFLRRRPKAKAYNDTICLNMFMDEQYLTIVREEQDLFSAYEVTQMCPIFDKNEMYQRFLQANLWVKKYLPNALKRIQHTVFSVQKKNQLSILEIFLRNLQLWYMRKKRTSEVIEDGVLRFHPHDARKWILDRYHAKLRSLAHFL